MSTKIDDLPNEIFELVVERLLPRDIINLRLVSRVIAQKISRHSLRRLFASCHCELTRPHLESLAQAVSAKTSALHIESITLVGMIYDAESLESTVETGVRYVPDPDSVFDNAEKQQQCTQNELTQFEQDLKTLKRRKAEQRRLRQDGTDVSLLRHVFAKLPHNGRRCPQRLTLEAVIDQGSGVKLSPFQTRHALRGSSIFLQPAIDTFTLAVSALYGSEISLQALSVFTTDPASLCCGLPCNILSRFDWHAPEFKSSFSTLKTLSISISDRTSIAKDDIDFVPLGTGHTSLQSTLKITDANQEDQSTNESDDDDIPKHEHNHDHQSADPFDGSDAGDEDDSELRARIMDSANFRGLPYLLTACPLLEQLHLSAFNTTTLRLEDDVWDLLVSNRPRQIAGVAKVVLPYLQTLYLGGFWATTKDIISILDNHAGSLRTVELQHIYLSTGALAPITKVLASRILHLNSITLTDINEQDEAMRFSGELEQQYTKISYRRHQIHRWGAGVKDEIACHRLQGRVLQSPHMRRYREQLRRQFGCGFV